jgi:hypothetical protein
VWFWYLVIKYYVKCVFIVLNCAGNDTEGGTVIYSGLQSNNCVVSGFLKKFIDYLDRDNINLYVRCFIEQPYGEEDLLQPTLPGYILGSISVVCNLFESTYF